MYKNSFLYSCKKTIHPILTKINRVRSTANCNMHTKFELNRMHSLDAIVFTHIHTHAHIHTYITAKIVQINSGALKTKKYVKISKSNFLTITILSFHDIYTKSKSIHLPFHLVINNNSQILNLLHLFNCYSSNIQINELIRNHFFKSSILFLRTKF